jgi:hypothetical protein
MKISRRLLYEETGYEEIVYEEIGMSVENGERFIRLLRQDESLREKVRTGGENDFLAVSEAAEASCTTYEVVAALLREME